MTDRTEMSQLVMQASPSRAHIAPRPIAPSTPFAVAESAGGEFSSGTELANDTLAKVVAGQRHTVVLMGAPAEGKSTLARSLVVGVQRTAQSSGVQIGVFQVPLERAIFVAKRATNSSVLEWDSENRGWDTVARLHQRHYQRALRNRERAMASGRIQQGIILVETIPPVQEGTEMLAYVTRNIISRPTTRTIGVVSADPSIQQTAFEVRPLAGDTNVSDQQVATSLREHGVRFSGRNSARTHGNRQMVTGAPKPIIDATKQALDAAVEQVDPVLLTEMGKCVQVPETTPAEHVPVATRHAAFYHAQLLEVSADAHVVFTRRPSQGRPLQIPSL